LKFAYIAPTDLTGKTELEVLLEVRELLRILVNEARSVRALVLGSQPDPDDLHAGEGGKG
jgi:hypothetical protein